MEFDCHHKAGQQNAMDIMPSEAEIILIHIIPIEIYDGHEQTLWGVPSVLVQSTEIILDFDVGYLLRVEHGLALPIFTFDQIFEQGLRD